MKNLILVFIVAFFLGDNNKLAQNEIDIEFDHTFIKVTDKVDPVNSKYPGGRGANELVVYTPLYGDSTGTNKYGIEAIVIENKIQTISGNNSKIPQNGFVISGHGEVLRWISNELFPGIEVHLNDNKLAFKISNESKIFFADYLVSEVEKKLNTWEALHESISIIDLSGLKHEINSIKQEYYDITNYNSKSKYSQSILAKAQEMYYKSFPSFNKEIRASWYRLREKNAEELEETIKLMAEIGFNAICPETIYGGYAIYPNAHPDLPQHPNFIGWDPMKELERLCKKYEIKLIPWVWVFFIGRENSPLVERKPEWLALSRQNEIPARNENNYHFFCPSRKEVNRFWIDVYEKLVTNYDIDGLQLDYIRYPVSLPNEHGFCYCDVCKSNFNSIANVNPLNIFPDKNPDKWEQWIDYRKEQITKFVGKVSNLLEEQKPNIKLSADVFPLFEESIAFKFQNWGNWLDKGYLDEIFTMSYSPEAEQVKKESKFLVEQLPDGIEGYVGLGPFMGFRPEILVKEIFYAQNAGANGVCLFSFGSLKPEQIDALKRGPFRLKATAN